MKASELRIGNFVALQEGHIEMPLTERRLVRVIEGTYDVEPIPIIKEWLDKFGFGFYELSQNILIELKLEQINEPELRFVMGYSTDISGNIELDLRIGAVCITDSKIKYVHQLQNLYFALTGNELTIKE